MDEDNAPDGRHAAHPEVVRVGALLVDVGLVDVVGPDGVECGDVARHSGHEAGQQGGEAEAQNAGGEEGEQHDGDGLVVVVDQDAVGVDHVLAGDGVGFDRDDAVGVGLVQRQGLALGVDVGGGDGGVCPVGQAAGVGGDGDGDQAGQDDQEGEKHLGHGGDERAPCGRSLRSRRPWRAGSPGSWCTSSRSWRRSRGPSPGRTTPRRARWCWRGPCPARSGSCWRGRVCLIPCHPPTLRRPIQTRGSSPATMRKNWRTSL